MAFTGDETGALVAIGLLLGMAGTSVMVATTRRKAKGGRVTRDVEI